MFNFDIYNSAIFLCEVLVFWTCWQVLDFFRNRYREWREEYLVKKQEQRVYQELKVDDEDDDDLKAG